MAQLRFLFVAALMACVGLSSAFSKVSVADERLRGAFELMFKESKGSWDVVKADVETHYRRAKTIAPGDSRVTYALALVALEHRRYKDADSLLSSAIKQADRPAADYHRMRCWLATLLRKYEAAISEAEQLAESMAKVKDANRRATNLTFLGRTMGFLSLPLEGRKIDADRLARADKTISETLSSEDRKAYDAAKQAINETFKSLHENYVERSAVEREIWAKKLEQDRLFVSRERERIAEMRQALESGRGEAQERLDSVLTRVTKEIAPLRSRFDALEAEARPHAERVADLSNQIQGWLALAARSRDRGQQAEYRQRASFLAGALSAARREYRRLDNQAAGLRQQIGRLEAEGRSAKSEYARRIKSIEKQEKSLASKSKALDRKETEIAADAGKTPTAVRLQEQKLKTPRSYDLWSRETEVERLLRSL